MLKMSAEELEAIKKDINEGAKRAVSFGCKVCL